MCANSTIVWIHVGFFKSNVLYCIPPNLSQTQNIFTLRHLISPIEITLKNLLAMCPNKRNFFTHPHPPLKTVSKFQVKWPTLLLQLDT